MKHLYLAFMIACSATAHAQQSPQVHAHNDYEKPKPFTNAYKHGAGSIEVDIFLHKGDLLVAHDTMQFDQSRTITSLYLNPLDSVIKSGTMRKLQLMIDLKTAAVPTLKELVKLLKQHPQLTRNKNLSVVISGNRPEPAAFKNYPAFILFDGLLNKKYSSKELKRVPMFSDNFKNYADTNTLKTAIKKAHQFAKTIRFWNAPDNPDMWQQLMRLGADWINTDQTESCAAFINNSDSATGNPSN